MKGQFDALVALLGLEKLLDRFPLSLSGGEKQRVAIGRALLSAPDILLMDEPLASLDLPRKRELMPYLQKLAKQVEIPVLYVTHSLEKFCRWRRTCWCSIAAASKRSARWRKSGAEAQCVPGCR